HPFALLPSRRERVRILSSTSVSSKEGDNFSTLSICRTGLFFREEGFPEPNHLFSPSDSGALLLLRPSPASSPSQSKNASHSSSGGGISISHKPRKWKSHAGSHCLRGE